MGLEGTARWSCTTTGGPAFEQATPLTDCWPSHRIYYQYSPEFHKYLTDYPHATLRGVSDVLFWSKDALPHLRPILSITHLSVYTPPDPGGMTLVAAKQLYADHYFEGEFDLMAVVDRPTPTGQGTYLIAIRRFRFDHLPSGGLLNLRGKAVGGLRDRMRSDLEHEKAATEKGT